VGRIYRSPALRLGRKVAAVGFALATALAPASAAQDRVPFDACHDRHGALIPGVVDDSLEYAGLATHQDGKPVILWNANSNRHLSDTEQIYIYLHECAHHLLGHLEQPMNSPGWELEADCWAIQLMVDGGMIKGRHLYQLERSRRTVRGDRTHLGGDAHVRSLRECLEIRTDRDAWRAALDAMLAASADGFAGSRGRVVDSLDGAPIYDSRLNLPGTYGCEVVGAAIRCMVFASRQTGPAVDRYRKLTDIVEDWLPAGWTKEERESGNDGSHAFLAQDGRTGTLVSVAQNGPRIHFLMKQVATTP
jgi:hypothetical protein